MATRVELPEPEDVDIDGTKVATYVLEPRGHASAGDLVFCHGTPWSARVWAAAAQALSRDHRVLLWDMPGYGSSPKDASVTIDLATQMERFARLLEYWQVRAPSVVAHDIGGAVALGAHLLHGAEYSRLMLWDIVTLEPWGSPFFRLVAEHADVFAALPSALHRALVREYVSGAAHRQLTPEWLDVLCNPWLGAEGQTAFYRQIAALRTEHTRPIAERLHAVRCETAIGWGAQDPWIPVEQATRLHAQLPGRNPVARLEGVGHLAPIEAQARVIEVLERWIGGEPVPSAPASERQRASVPRTGAERGPAS